MSFFDDEKKKEKRAKSEAQRLDGIRAKQQLEEQRQTILSQALRGIGHQSKRIVFDDSDENEENPDFSRAHTTSLHASHVKLFDGCSSDDDNIESLLNVTSRHVGKKGEKLMKLEARFNYDSRFKLDEKFASSGSDDNSEDVFEERARNLEVLSKVLGGTVEPSKKAINKTSDEHATVRPFTRFDPFNEEHVSWLKKDEVNQVTNKISKEDSVGECSSHESNNSEKANEVHFEMQADFVQELKSRLSGEGCGSESGAGFSFLAMIGRESAIEEGRDISNRNEDTSHVKKLEMTTEGRSVSDSGIHSRKIDHPLEQAVKGTKKFFVTGDEPHLQSLVNNFKRTQSLEKTVSRWANHRDIFSKLRMSFVDGSLAAKTEKEPNFYRMLGCDRTSSVDQITAEYRARVRYLHPDKLLEECDQKKEEYLRLQSAYATLSDSQERQCYDSWLDCILPIGYEDFKRNQDAVKLSMHWAVPKSTPMISMSDVEEQQEIRKREISSSTSWEHGRFQSDVVRKFRNYEL